VDEEVRDEDARFRMEDLDLEDYFNIVNALTDGAITPEVEATVSFDVRWDHLIRKHRVHNPDQQVEGRYLQTRAKINWSGSNENGDEFESDKSTQTVFAAVARERNGRFFD